MTLRGTQLVWMAVQFTEIGVQEEKAIWDGYTKSLVVYLLEVAGGHPCKAAQQALGNARWACKRENLHQKQQPVVSFDFHCLNNGTFYIDSYKDKPAYAYIALFSLGHFRILLTNCSIHISMAPDFDVDSFFIRVVIFGLNFRPFGEIISYFFVILKLQFFSQSYYCPLHKRKKSNIFLGLHISGRRFSSCCPLEIFPFFLSH